MMKKLSFLLALVLVLSAFIAACNDSTEETFICNYTISQVEDEQKIEITWETEAEIASMKVTVTHGDVVTVNDFDSENLGDKVTVNADYGKIDVAIEATSKDGKTNTYSTQASLSAKEYIIAPISGSMPQLYFTLNMNEITNNGEIPAFVWLARPESWNWDKLPQNVFPMPTVDKSEVLTHENYERMVEVTNAYIQELYSVDPDSKFNLYINDANAYLYLKLLVANGIPEDKYYVTLLSDGGMSYSSFNLAFNSEDANFDADAKYADMAAKLDALYGEVKEQKDYYYGDSFTVDTTTFKQYSYVAAREKDNVEWWILRPRAGVLCSPDEDFINRVLNDDKVEGIIEERNFANPLKEMTDEDKAELKALYNFNNEMFEAADESGKKAMMILGSWAYAENEPDFNDYVNLVKTYYGDEFVYYYKGHPNTPTVNHPDKQAQLEELGLTDVESSINAELILFFYPDIYMCGYPSSTFLSVESQEMACTIFNKSKADAYADENMASYVELIGIFASKITNDSQYASLCQIADHNYYLMELTRDEKADIGIFDANDKVIKYYNITDSGFEEAE